MQKLVYLLKARQHFWNRIKLRKGNVLYFFLSEIIDQKDNCLVWKYKQHLYFTQNNKLQTYIKLKI
jgi:hypothetical protein